jgi:hypothetical protein
LTGSTTSWFGQALSLSVIYSSRSSSFSTWFFT